MNSNRKARVGFAALLAGIALLACAPVQLYPGPPRATEELVVIEARSPSRITRIDGQSVNVRRAEILPGFHSLEFYGEFGELMAAAGVVVGERQSRPLLKMRCAAEVESMEAGVYTFSANADVDRRSSGPDPSYRWHETIVHPGLVDAEGNELSGLTCDETCRLRGRKDRSNVSRACDAESP